MPVYEYMCETHGVFETIRPMADHAAPCPCPVCGQDAPRVMLTVPRLAMMEAGNRRAHETNERSSHEPKSTRTHGPGCSCCGGSKSNSKTLRRPDGSKSFPTKRPWMISH
ncbi:MAG: zinc ribbon domain-containing protein [Pseudomonadota bacterium]